MMSFFSRVLAACVLLGGLGGCASNLDHSSDDSQIPKGAPHVPQAAPVTHVQAVPLPAPAPPPASAVTPPATIKVAVLLPLTGKNAALGQAMMNAAQQAVFDIAPPNFELMPRDTGGSEEQVDVATRDAVASGAQLLIGPLFAAHVPTVHLIAQNNNINMLTLSTDTSLAAPGLFVMGFAPGAQVDRVVNFAAAHGQRHFAALIPTGAYGALVGQAFRRAVERAGGTLVALAAYDPDQHDSDLAVRDLAAHRTAIDALFLPEGGDELVKIAGQLASYGFDPRAVHVLGTGLWDMPGLGRQSPLLVGGWYAASDPALRRHFMDTYTGTFGQSPPRLATLAYDATALAAVLARRGAVFDQAALTNPNGFSGLDGIFRLTQQGLVERGLAVLEVAADGDRVVDAAPTTFAVGIR